MKALLLAGLAATLSLLAQPKVQRFTLPNGLRVIHLEDHEHPMVRARLHLNLQPEDVPAGHQGLAQLTLRMFSHSDTADLKAKDLDRTLEDSGIQLSSSLAPDGLDWRLVMRSRDQDRALGLLADRLLRPLFDPNLLELQRLACWRQEERREVEPRLRVRLALMQDPASQPTQNSLGTISLEDLQAFHAKVFRPGRAVLILHGDLGLEQAKRLVLLSLGSWTAQELPVQTKPPLATPTSKLPSSIQDSARIPLVGAALEVQAVAPRPTQVSMEAATLLALLVPGDASLLPVQVTPGEGCLVAMVDGDANASGASVWSLLRARLDSLCNRGFSQSDLDRARSAWLARGSLDSLHPEAQMDAALTEAMGPAVSPDGMKALSLETLNAGLRAWLDPAAFRVGATGDPELLKSLPPRP